MIAGEHDESSTKDNEIEVSICDTIRESTIDRDSDSIYRSFFNVVYVKNYHRFAKWLDTNYVVKSIDLMILRTREKSLVCEILTFWMEDGLWKNQQVFKRW